MHRYLLLLFIICGAALSAQAQRPDLTPRKSKTDSIYRKIDSTESKRFVPKVRKERVYTPDTNHSPHKAVMHSLMVPGWGQIYNKKNWWWKAPAIWGGLGALGYNIVVNQRTYEDFLAVAKFQKSGKTVDDPEYVNDPRKGLYEKYGGYSSEAIINAKDGYLRNRDISILGFLAVWGINVVDAYIEAKFIHSFTVDNNFAATKFTISTMEQPVLASNFNTTFTPVLKITFLLK